LYQEEADAEADAPVRSTAVEATDAAEDEAAAEIEMPTNSHEHGQQDGENALPRIAREERSSVTIRKTAAAKRSRETGYVLRKSARGVAAAAARFDGPIFTFFAGWRRGLAALVDANVRSVAIGRGGGNSGGRDARYRRRSSHRRHGG
jgi:hypothetical protein